MAERPITGGGWRLLVIEASARLAFARGLVEWVPLRYWRRLLGSHGRSGQAAGIDQIRARVLARAVERASMRLPFATKCLPRAMALHAMMRRRAIPGELVIGVLDRSRRGTIEDLHAWVETEGEVLIGAVDQPFHPLIRFGDVN